MTTQVLHDSELVSLSIDRNRATVRLGFRMEDDSLRTAEFQGLRAFRCEDLIKQNVVSRVWQSSLGEIDHERVKYWLTWITSFSDGSSWRNAQEEQKWFDECIKGILNLVVIEPSVGVQIVGLCECFSVIEKNEYRIY